MGQLLGPISGNAASYTVVNMPAPGVFGPTVVNSFTTLSVPAYWRAVNFKSANMASFPRSVHKNGIETPHRLDKLLQRKPNGYQSPTMCFRTWFFHQAHYQNGYLEIERDSLFNPIAVHNRRPEIVAPFRYLEDDGSITQWYYVQDHAPHFVASSDMMHLTGTSYDGMSGLNPNWTHGETFERARLLDRYITRFLVKGSIVRGSIELPAGLSQEQQDAVVSTIRRFKGADAEDDLLVLSDGTTLNNKTLSNDQSQLIELHQLSTKQIGQITDVNPYFLFDDPDGKYNGNPEQAGEDVVRYCFRLLIEQAEDELIKLLSEADADAGYTVHIDPAALIRGDVETEAAVVVQLKAAGIINGNEARQETGYPQSSDPEATKLKTSGDTTPAKATKDTNAPQKSNQTPAVTVESFTALIADAASRVMTKTNKATSAALKKHVGDSFTIWGNVFAQEQEGHAVEAVTPIIDTIAAVIGQPQAKDTAVKIGQTYASQLRGHYARMIRNEESTAPDLQEITLNVMRGNHEPSNIQ